MFHRVNKGVWYDDERDGSGGSVEAGGTVGSSVWGWLARWGVVGLEDWRRRGCVNSRAVGFSIFLAYGEGAAMSEATMLDWVREHSDDVAPCMGCDPRGDDCDGCTGPCIDCGKPTQDGVCEACYLADNKGGEGEA